MILCLLVSGMTMQAQAAKPKRTARPQATATAKPTAAPKATEEPTATAVPSKSTPEAGNTAAMSPVVSVSPATLTLSAGKGQRLKLVYSNKKMSGTVTWTSSNNKVATVSSYGTVRAVGKGSCVITATVKVGKKTYTATCSVKVIVPVASITLSTRHIDMRVGQSTALPSVTVKPSNASSKKVTWKVDKKGVVEITSDGKIKALGLGTVTITCVTAQDQDRKVSASFTVSVAQPVTGITMKNTLRLTLNETLSLDPTVLPKNASNKNLTFTSSDYSVAGVDASGRVTGKNVGKAVITCTAADGSGVKARCTVTVSIRATSLTSTVKSPIVITQGVTRTIMTSILPVRADPQVKWTVTDDSVATMTDLGLTAIKPGKTRITAATTDGSKLTLDFDVIVEPVNPVVILGITRTGKSGEGECLYIKPKNVCASRTVKSFIFHVTLADENGKALDKDIVCEWAVSKQTIAPGKQPAANQLHWPKLTGLTSAAKVGITVTKVEFNDNTAFTIPEDQRVTKWFE